MTLKRLEIQGYKSFASRAEFVFDGGITAIVGPNGSGKSNIADAIRWVLGEQSYSVLRAKRTDDLIYSGSAHRSRLGLAEVSLTLDNSRHWLPLDYAEVTLTRRATRSGENEYLLNGSRVRLRDIQELLTRGGLGRNASAVIGQGQVDAALSLRPEERRSLFEEAAGVRLYIEKRNEALTRLEETRHNLERVNDIVNEIAPRLETLRRQAERTQAHAQLKSQLDDALLTWYGHQWRLLRERLEQAESRLSEQDTLAQRLRDQAQEGMRAREALRARQQALRDSIRQHRVEADRLRSRWEDLRRRLAVATEQSRSVQRQLDQTDADIAGINAHRSEIQDTIARHEQALLDLASDLAKHQANVATAKSKVAAAEAQQRAQRDELEQARAHAFELATSQAALRNRAAQVQRRQAELRRELDEQEAALLAAGARVSAAAAELEAANLQRQALADAAARATEQLRAAEDDLAAAESQHAACRRERDLAHEEYHRLATQWDVLQRTRSQSSYLHEGTQAVLRENLPGVLGSVAALIHVPPELELALEASLGGHLEDIVVQTWADALRCIEILKRGNRGRATFLPLDYVRPPQPIRAPQMPGVRGIASQLVRTDPAYQGICELLLGNIVIVEDLPAGRRALAAEARLRRAVTLDGDAIESRGVVRGGSRPRSRGFLAIEREWRELPERLADSKKRLDAADNALRAAETKQQSARALERQMSQQAQSARQALADQDVRLNALQQRHERLTQEHHWRQSLHSQAQHTLTTLQEEAAQIQSDLASVEAGHYEATQRLEVARLAGADGDLLALHAQVSEAETALAVTLRGKQAQEELLATQREMLVRTEAEAQARVVQRQRLLDQLNDLASQVASLSSELEDVRALRQATADPISDAEAELQETERQQAHLEREAEALRQQLQAQVAEHAKVAYERDRIQSEIADLQRHIEADLGPVTIPDDTGPRQLVLNLGQTPITLAAPSEIPEGLGARIREMRSALRRLGPVNPEAPAEYDKARERHAYLTQQIEDLTRAADAARQVITDLNQVIRDRFVSTFSRVALEFSACFHTLFAGGAARLQLTEPDNPEGSGIDILARPPGKRSQSLALLSGGERALTAAALLFALLRVNPLPFCVLDEVDAMLDEANVHRFRDFLRSLAQHTQFIVITHNRSTIEAASTVYGISMGREGASQVLSMSLPEANTEASEAVSVA
ncbi:MAG: chromosome segregation protein SMC [Anaerolineae bacterium]